VKLPDANLLVYAYDEHSPHRPASRAWLERALSGRESLAFAWLVLVAFVRLSTNPRISAEPYSAGEALDIVDGWLAQPNATIVHPTQRHAAVLRELLEPLGTAGNLTGDAHLAALAIEHGATLYSADADFFRFPGLNWQDPVRTR
jgi:toxin-antitoxin system PIN domain toxin